MSLATTSARVPTDPLPPTETAPMRRAPGPREMALVAGLAFLLSVFAGIVLQLANVRAGLVLTQALFIAGPAVLSVRWFYLDRRRVLPFGRPRPAALAGALLGAAALNHLLTLYGAWQESVFPTPEAIRSLFDGLFAWHGPADFALLLTVFSVVPAVCEELLFRGYLQSGIMERAGRPAAGIVVSALVFGLFHLDPWRFAGVFGIGIFLAWLRLESGSLVLPMAAHALSNAVSIALKASGRLEGDPPGGRWSALGAVALLALAVTLVRSARRPSDRVL